MTFLNSNFDNLLNEINPIIANTSFVQIGFDNTLLATLAYSDTGLEAYQVALADINSQNK